MSLSFAAFILWIAGSAVAQSPDPSVGAPSTPSYLPDPVAEEPELPWTSASLEDLGFHPSMRRYHTDPFITFGFQTRGDEVLTEARLRLTVAPPDAAWESVEGLEVLVNDESVGILPVETLLGRREHTVLIDSRLLSERNTLTLHWTQGTTSECQPNVPSGSWTLVEEGTLETRGTPLPLNSDLGVLPLPFLDPLYDRGVDVPVVLFSDPEPAVLHAAGLVAGWLGTLGGSELRFPVSRGVLPEESAIVLIVGTAPFELGALPPAMGPTVSLIDHPRAPGTNRKLLVLAGPTAADVLTAAMGLLQPAEALWGPTRTVERPTLVESVPYESPRWLPPRSLVRFADIPGGGDLVHRGLRGRTMELTFRVAPDLFVWPRDLLRLEVDYRQIAPRKGLIPTVVVELNGRYVTRLPRVGPDTATGSHTARVELHRSQLRGFNRLQFHVSWSDLPDICDPALDESVETAILPTSTIHFDDAPHFLQLPNIEAFVEDGFPFTRRADLAETAVVLPKQPTDAELSTLLSLFAHFASVTGTPPWAVSFLSADALGDTLPRRKDLLVVGSLAQLPSSPALRDHLPLRVEGSRFAVADVPWEDQALDLLGGYLTFREIDEVGELLATTRKLGIVMGMRSPVDDARSVVVVTGVGDDALPSVRELLGFATAHVPGGDVLVVREDERWRFRLGRAYDVGEIEPYDRLRWVLATHWMVLLPILGFAALLLGLAWKASLEQRAWRRLAESSRSEA